MRLRLVLFACVLLHWQCELGSAEGELFIADYTQNEDISDWVELSDTVRTEGKSKAVMVRQSTKLFKRAILFTLINPQPCGAGFAGVLKRVSLDLSSYGSLKLKLRGQGQYSGYKIVMRHRGEFGEEHPSYCHFFEAPQNDFGEISLPLNEFKPYIRGKVVERDDAVLDKAQITTIGIQAYGGVYQPVKQSGTASLEIDWIKAV